MILSDLVLKLFLFIVICKWFDRLNLRYGKQDSDPSSASVNKTESFLVFISCAYRRVYSLFRRSDSGGRERA